MDNIMNMPRSPKSPKEFDFPDPNSLMVTEQDIRQIEIFFLSLKSRVYVCPALANLYFTTLEDMANLGGWDLKTTGFPTLIFERPDPDTKTEGKLQLCVAEKGTGFVLWKDILSEESNYKAPGRTFHTLSCSGQKGKLIGLSFDNEEAADSFHATVRSWIDEDYTLKNVTNNNKKVKERKKKNSKAKLLRKNTISMPCCFEHVTKLDHESFIQRTSMPRMKPFIPASPDVPAPLPPVAGINRSPRNDLMDMRMVKNMSEGTGSHYDGTGSHYDGTGSHYEGTGSHYEGTGSHYAGSVACNSESTSNEDSGLDEI